MANISEAAELPEVLPRIAGIDVRANPDETGALVAQSLQRFGAGATDAGKFFGQMAADDAATTYVTKASDIQSKLRSLSGADALNYLPQAKQDLQSLYEDTSSGLTTNESQLAFDQSTKFYRARVLGDVDDYGAAQQKEYGRQTNKGMMDAGADLAAKSQLNGDQAGLRQAHQMMRDAYVKNLQLDGLGNDPTLRAQAQTEADRHYTVSRLTAALGSGNADQANEIWNTNQNNLVGASDYDRLGAAVQATVGTHIASTFANPKSPIAGAPEAGGGPSPNNIGNVKTSAAATSGAQSFLQPATPEDGVALTVQNLQSGYKGLTLALIGPKWTGEGDQKGAEWAANVSRVSGIPVNAVPNLADPKLLGSLVLGIGTAEKLPGDLARFTPDVIARGVQAGLSGTSPATGAPSTDLVSTYQQRVDSAVGEAYRQYPGNDAFADKVRAETETRLNQQISEQARFSTAVRLNVSRGFENAQAMLDRGMPATAIPSDDIISRAYATDPDQAQATTELAQQMRQVSTYLGMIPGAPPDQIANIRRQVQPDPAHPETFAKMSAMSTALDRALTARAHALSTDPANYVVTSQPGIASLMQASWQDYSKFPLYATQVRASQTQMGVPAERQHLLPQYAAQHFAQDLSADPGTTQQKITTYTKEFGSEWPAVFRDISSIGGLSAQYQSIAMLPAKDGYTLSRVLATGRDGKDVGALIQPNDAAAIRDNVRGHLQQFASSLAASQLPPRQIEAITNSVVSLAYGNSAFNSLPPDQAATAAVNAFTSRYSYIGRARVPADKQDVISDNARARLDSLTGQNTAIPPVLNTPGAPTGDEYLHLLKSTPTWITAPNGDAMWLMDMGGRVVRDRRGNPVSVPFNSGPVARPAKTPLIVPGL